MERIVYFENKRIVEISKKELPTGYGNRIQKNAKVYIFEDGSFIKATETKNKNFKYICCECGCEKFSTTKPEYSNKPYICNTCRGLNHNPFKGKKHSQEFKDKLSKERIGVYAGEKNPMYGKSWKDYTTQEVIEGHRQKQIDNYNNLPIEEKQKRSENFSKLQKRLLEENPQKYREQRSKAGIITAKTRAYQKTSIEIKVENWLKEHNINYEYSCIMGHKDSCFQYDFIIHGKRTLIEVNGDYWHGNPNKFNIDGNNGKRKLNEIQLRGIEKDKIKKQFAEEHNFEVIYIWEEEINNNDFSKLEILL